MNDYVVPLDNPLFPHVKELHVRGRRKWPACVECGEPAAVSQVERRLDGTWSPRNWRRTCSEECLFTVRSAVSSSFMRDRREDGWGRHNEWTREQGRRWARQVEREWAKGRGWTERLAAKWGVGRSTARRRALRLKEQGLVKGEHPSAWPATARRSPRAQAS